MKRFGRVESSVSLSLSVSGEMPDSESRNGERFEDINSYIPFCSGLSCFFFGGRDLDPACSWWWWVDFWGCSSASMSIFV